MEATHVQRPYMPGPPLPPSQPSIMDALSRQQAYQVLRSDSERRHLDSVAEIERLKVRIEELEKRLKNLEM